MTRRKRKNPGKTARRKMKERRLIGQAIAKLNGRIIPLQSPLSLIEYFKQFETDEEKIIKLHDAQWRAAR